MQEKQLFEYAVIRLVPRVEREEFLNVGVILYCASKKFLECKYSLNEERINALFPDTDVDEVQQRLNAFKDVCAGKKDGGTIERLPVPSRFRWLTATRSTILQTSKVHPGMCSEPAFALAKLFKDLVEVY